MNLVPFLLIFSFEEYLVAGIEDDEHACTCRLSFYTVLRNDNLSSTRNENLGQLRASLDVSYRFGACLTAV